MEKVFRALADPSRRLLLDRLFERDGQSLRELEAHLPEMSRFGVMKHLQVLSDAHLVVTRRSGRQKHHFLNAVPIQLVYDRWVSKYAQPWAEGLVALKQSMESTDMTTTTETTRMSETTHPAGARPRLVHEIYIRTSADRLFQALTDGELTRQYYMGTAVESSWTTGAPYTYRLPDGSSMLDGEVLEIDPPRRMVMTFQPRWVEGAGVSRVTYEITPVGDSCRLTVLHDDLDPAQALTAGIADGWNRILSSLKSLLETGQPLVITPAG